MTLSGNNEQEHNAANTGNTEPANQTGGPDPQMGSRGTGFYSPVAPSDAKPPDNDPHKWRENTKLVVELIGLFVLCAYTCFSCLQWLQIRWTNRLTREALDDNGYALSQTLGKMQGQIDATNHLYLEAQKQTGHSSTLAINSGTEASAARSAADTAKETLHVSERAYVVTAMPKLGPGKNVVIPVVNDGRIPSGPFSVQVFEISTQGNKKIEGHWSTLSSKEGLSPVGVGLAYNVSLALPEIDIDSVDGTKAGSQGIVVAGTISYNDGFPKTQEQHTNFCMHSFFLTDSKTLEWIPCNADDAIPKMMKAIDYPKNYQEAVK